MLTFNHMSCFRNVPTCPRNKTTPSWKNGNHAECLNHTASIISHKLWVNDQPTLYYHVWRPYCCWHLRYREPTSSCRTIKNSNFSDTFFSTCWILNIREVNMEILMLGCSLGTIRMNRCTGAAFEDHQFFTFDRGDPYEWNLSKKQLFTNIQLWAIQFEFGSSDCLIIWGTTNWEGTERFSFRGTCWKFLQPFYSLWVVLCRGHVVEG